MLLYIMIHVTYICILININIYTLPLDHVASGLFGSNKMVVELDLVDLRE